MATPVTAANFSATGWGFSSISNVAGDQTRSTITVTAGNGAIISPIITFTFPDGPYPTAPLAIAKMVGGTGMYADLAVDRFFTDSITFIYTDLPQAGKTYVFMWDILGI